MENEKRRAEDAELDKLKALAGNATPGEWKIGVFGQLNVQDGKYMLYNRDAGYIRAAQPAAILRIAALVAQQAARIEELEAALLTVEKWTLPVTGKTWDDGSPMSYAACYGSNGERDYMRRVARNAVFGTDIATSEGK